MIHALKAYGARLLAITTGLAAITTGLVAITTGLAAVLLAACTELGAPEQREVLIPADKLSELLARRLTLDRKVLDVFQVRTGRPVVILDPPAQRLRVDLDLSLSHPFSSRPLQGQAAISGGLAFDAATLTVMLTDPKIEKLAIDSAPAALRDPLSRLGSALGSELLPSYPLAKLEPDQLTFLGQEYRVLGFDIVPQGLKVILRAKH